jgi:TolA-binding protein
VDAPLSGRRIRAALLAAVLALAACGSGGAEALLETAKLEEIQNNPTHARALYEEIVRRYPGSPEAKTADERLRALAPKQ